MQPLKPNFNPKLTKLLQEEWRFQRELETETLLHLQKFGNFPQDLDICTSASNEIIDVPTKSTGGTVKNYLNMIVNYIVVVRHELC